MLLVFDGQTVDVEEFADLIDRACDEGQVLHTVDGEYCECNNPLWN